MIERVKVTAHISGWGSSEAVEIVSGLVPPRDAACGFDDRGESILELLLAGQSVKALRIVGGLTIRFLMEPVTTPVEM